MARTLLMDPIGGLAGDMLLGGLLALGCPADLLREQLASLGLPEFELVVETVTRRGLGATRARFELPEEETHRHLPEILELIREAGLPEPVSAKAEETFRLLAKAEAAVHEIPIHEVHFHEVGAADAILDITGVCLALHELDVARLLCGPLPGGSGTVTCAHGELPVPAPAVIELLEGFPLRIGVGEGEMVTPTGAALLRAWGEELPAGLVGRPGRTGYGAGTREGSVLRLGFLELEEVEGKDQVWVFQTHLDDSTGEELGFLAELLFEAGALDVAYHPLTMKKGRPGVALTCLSPTDKAEEVRETLLVRSSTLGVREQLVDRTVLPRRIEQVPTCFGPIPVKVTRSGPEPEYGPCAAVARQHGLALREVYEEVRRAFRER